MGKRIVTAPLKAYEVYYVIDYGFRTQEWSCGIHAGRTPGQARARVATDMSRNSESAWRGLRSRRVSGPAAEAAIEAEADRNKHWRDTQRFARLQAAADAFNAAWPVGTPVEVPTSWLLHDWLPWLTITRTPAWVTPGLQLLVSVEGVPGGVDFARVVPLVEPQPC